MPGLNSHQFPEVYRDLGIDLNALGCVMLSMEPLDVVAEYGLDRGDLHYTEDASRFWIQGDVVRTKAHATLLYGLLQPGPVWEDHIREVLADWEAPESVEVASIDVFPSPFEDENYGCIVARLKVSDSILDAHRRLSLLPHVNTFGEYVPHVTIAYVKPEAIATWRDVFRAKPPVLTPTGGLDLGGH